MLDLKWIRSNPEELKVLLKAKNSNFDLEEFFQLDVERREKLAEVESLKQYRNTISEKIGLYKREKRSVDELMAEMKNLADRIKDLDKESKKIEHDFLNLLLLMPNKFHNTVPIGNTEADNIFVSSWGDTCKQKVVYDHQQIAQDLRLVDFSRASKLSGSGFSLYRSKGALLERALINFMLDVHTKEHCYEEVSPPFIVNEETMIGTGQLPKLADDMYTIQRDNLYLIPTAEVPVTNLYRGEILKEEELPKAFVAYTPCFRREAGAYGKDTKGLMRLHQFDKVELVRLVHPEDSYTQLELLRSHAEKILQLLELPYRVIELCSADLSFAAAKCYDIEVWSPSQERYLEVSSCSNFEDFQARRMALKFKPKGGKATFLHTLNGSGIALARTFIAILENYIREDGSLEVPFALRSYLGCDTITK